MKSTTRQVTAILARIALNDRKLIEIERLLVEVRIKLIKP